MALGAALLVAAGVVRAEIHVGDAFPELSAALEGGPAPAIAGKVALVDFWASWCEPCRASFPAYARIQSDFAPRGLVLVAVSVDQRADACAAFVRRFNPPFLTVRDGTQELVRKVVVPAMPTSYLIGRDGKVRFIHQGFHGAETEAELRREIESLLAEKSP